MPVHARTDDLTTMDVDVVVNAANEHLAHGGGVAAALARAGGPTVQAESDDWVAANGPVADGSAAVTTAGEMPARWVVHVVGPRFAGDGTDADRLATAVRAALDEAADLEARSVALPAISAGVFGYPLDEATAVIARTAVAWDGARPDALDITLVGVDERATDAFRAGLGST